MLGPGVLRWWLDPDALAARILGDEPVPRNGWRPARSSSPRTSAGSGTSSVRAPEPDGYHARLLETSRRREPRREAGARPTHHLPFDPSLVVRDAWGALLLRPRRRPPLADLPDTTLVEMKHRPSKSRSQYKKDDPPDYYASQVRHQMMVVGEEVRLLVAHRRTANCGSTSSSATRLRDPARRGVPGVLRRSCVRPLTGSGEWLGYRSPKEGRWRQKRNRAPGSPHRDRQGGRHRGQDARNDHHGYKLRERRGGAAPGARGRAMRVASPSSGVTPRSRSRARTASRDVLDLREG